MSNEGLAYARVNKYWGTDPGTGIEDDVKAYNMRLAMIAALNESEPDQPREETDDDVARKHIEGTERAKKLGDQLRSVYG